MFLQQWRELNHMYPFVKAVFLYFQFLPLHISFCLLFGFMTMQPINFGFWNTRGLNDPIKQKEVKSFVNKNKLSLLGLLEHKIKEDFASRIIKFVCPQWDFVNNYSHAPSGRIFCVLGS